MGKLSFALPATPIAEHATERLVLIVFHALQGDSLRQQLSLVRHPAQILIPLETHKTINAILATPHANSVQEQLIPIASTVKAYSISMLDSVLGLVLAATIRTSHSIPVLLAMLYVWNVQEKDRTTALPVLQDDSSIVINVCLPVLQVRLPTL